MALYSYEAFSKDGKKVKGTIDASSVASVREQLGKQGLFPTKISTAQEGEQIPWWRRIFMRGVSAKEKILFTKQLGILLKSGVPLLQAVELLVDQFEGRLHTILVAIKDDLKEGTSLADAMNKYPKVFDNIYVQLVRAGEASGKLEIILERLTAYMERRQEVAARVKGALQYPMIQMLVAIGVVIVLLTFVLPQLTKVFEGTGQELPATTRFLMASSDFLRNHYIILLIILIVIVAAFNYWRRTPKGALTLDKIKLKIPVLKYLVKTNAVVQFSYTLGMLLQAGVNLAQALDITTSIIDNQVLANALKQARDKIVKQGKIAQFLKKTDVFPPIAIYLIQTGEESGQLGQMLLTVAENYEGEVTELVDRLVGFLNPLTLLFMAGVVGFIIMSIMMPIMQMNQGLGGPGGETI